MDKKCTKVTSFREMLRYADAFDYFLLVVGIGGSIATGFLNPVISFTTKDIHTVLMATHGDILHNVADLDNSGVKVLWTCLKLAIIASFLFLFGYISSLSFYWLCERQIQIIRKHFFFAILHKDIEWYNSHQAGAFTRKMTAVFDQLKDGISDKLGFVCHSVTSLLCGIAIAFYMNWKMASVMLTAAPFITL